LSTPRPLREGAAPSLGAHLRKLVGHSAVYGSADVFTNVVNLLLVRVYSKYLTPTDYGNLALLILFGTVAKIVFRMGLDAGFFRVHYELETDRERRRLAGTVALFAAATGAILFGLVVLGAPLLVRGLFGASSAPRVWVWLVAGDVFLGTFAFVPASLLRIQDRPRLFSALSMGRHAINTVLKVVLVVRGAGVTGVLWSDFLATAFFSAALLPILLRNAELAFSRARLREVLAFGLPKVPHGALVQALNMADRKILDLFASRADVGLYHMGYTFGQGVKFGTSAFEPAWQPFVYAQLREPEAPRTLARVVTYAFAGFVTLALAVGLLGPDLLKLLTPDNHDFWAAGPFIPVVALAYLLHGVFLLSSIGIGISKKAGYYPLVTALAAGANIGADLWLIPTFGSMGAAWATVLGYGVMAMTGFVLSRRLYPVPFEWMRLGGVFAAALAIWFLGGLGPEAPWPALVFKAALLVAFPLVLLATVLPTERAWLRQQWRHRFAR
jgi:O-antigen/teichoic acid export membrane protein